MKLFKAILATMVAFVGMSLNAEQQITTEVGAGWRYTEINSCFKNMNFTMINARSKVLADNYYGRLDVDYGWMSPVTKKNSFSMYFADNEDDVEGVEVRTKSTQKGFTYDLSAAVGYPFAFENGNFTVIPVIGYSFHKVHQNGKYRTAFEESSTVEPETNDFVVYKAKCKSDWKWHSPFIGVDMGYKMDCFNFFAELEYHPNFFQFKKYQQAFIGSIGASYQLDCQWTVGVRVDYRYFTNKSRKHHLGCDEFVDVLEKCSSEPVRGKHVQSVGARVEVAYLF